MTQLEKDQKLADLKAQIEALEAVPVTTYKVWEPGGGNQYYAASILSARGHCCTNYDFSRIEAGLTHPSKEAAERHHSFLVMLHDLHKFAVEHNEGWKPDFMEARNLKYSIGMDHGNLIVTTWRDGFNSILPYFKSDVLAQKAIDTFGDRLKILFEYYNS